MQQLAICFFAFLLGGMCAYAWMWSYARRVVIRFRAAGVNGPFLITTAMRKFPDLEHETWKSQDGVTWESEGSPFHTEYAPPGIADFCTRYVESWQHIQRFDEERAGPDIYVCETCGGTDVQVVDWVDPNTNKVVGGDPPPGDPWCGVCVSETKLKVIPGTPRRVLL